MFSFSYSSPTTCESCKIHIVSDHCFPNPYCVFSSQVPCLLLQVSSCLCLKVLTCSHSWFSAYTSASERRISSPQTVRLRTGYSRLTRGTLGPDIPPQSTRDNNLHGPPLTPHFSIHLSLPKQSNTPLAVPTRDSDLCKHLAELREQCFTSICRLTAFDVQSE